MGTIPDDLLVYEDAAVERLTRHHRGCDCGPCSQARREIHGVALILYAAGHAAGIAAELDRIACQVETRRRISEEAKLGVPRGDSLRAYHDAIMGACEGILAQLDMARAVPAES